MNATKPKEPAKRWQRRRTVPPAVLAWRERHPLYLWAIAAYGHCDVLQIAALTGVVRQTVYTWLWGLNLPDIARMDKIERASKGSVTIRSWMDWYSSPPKNVSQKRRPATTRRVYKKDGKA